MHVHTLEVTPAIYLHEAAQTCSRYRVTNCANGGFGHVFAMHVGCVTQLNRESFSWHGESLHGHEGRVFQHVSKLAQEGHGRCAVCGHVVEGERQGHHAAYANLAIFHGRFLNHAANAQNACFWRVQNGGEAVYAQHADVTDGERAAGYFIHVQSTFAGPACHIAHMALQLFQGVRVGLFDVGDDEPVGQSHGNTEVDALMQMDAVILKRGVHDGMALESTAYGEGNDIVVRNTILWIALVPLAERIAQPDHLGHVQLHKDRQLGRSLQAGVHVVGNQLAHAFHRHNGVLRRRLLRCGFFRLGRIHSAQDVRLGNPTALAGAGHLAEIHTLLAGKGDGLGAGVDAAAGIRRALHIFLCDGAVGPRAFHCGEVHAQVFGEFPRGRHGRHKCAVTFRSFFGGWRIGACGRLRRGIGHGSGSKAFRRLSCRGDNPQHSLDRRHLPLRHDDLKQNSAGWRFHRVSNFIGLHLEKRFSLVHRIALRFQPTDDLSFFHGQAPFGHDHLLGHDIPPRYLHLGTARQCNRGAIGNSQFKLWSYEKYNDIRDSGDVRVQDRLAHLHEHHTDLDNRLIFINQGAKTTQKACSKIEHLTNNDNQREVRLSFTYEDLCFLIIGRKIMYSLFRDGDSFGIHHDTLQVPESQEAMVSRQSRCKESSVNYASWKRFVEKGWLPEGELEEALVNSWRRCIDKGVDHAPRSCWDFTPMKQLEPFTSILQRIGTDIETETYKAIKGKQLLITITNAEGRVARTCGDLEILRQADKLNFGPGANWAEESVGTNAIGTALFTGRPMQVFGEEHFCRSHHKWSCTAAPIFDPHGNIWGCFDISGAKNADHSNSLSLVLQAVRAMEQRLCQFYCSEIEGKMTSLFSSMFNSVMMGIVTLNNMGQIISSNSAAESLLGRSGRSLRGRKGHELFDFDTLLAKSKHASMNEPVVLKCYANPSLFVRAIPIFDTNGCWNDTIVTISETQRSKAHAPVGHQKKHAPVQGFEKVLHSSVAMHQAVQQAAKAAKTPSTVLLSGESGTGKELFAKGIHQAGPRSKGPFVAVNCGAFAGELIQSELFGYKEGAFTGAVKRGRIGKFEKAHTGVLFLDEVSEMPLSQQVNLLRVLEERAIVPVGGNNPRPIDVKVIAATNKDLWHLVEKGDFREDLYYRLNVVGIAIPALRKRGEDILLLARHHLHRLCSEFGLQQAELDPETEHILMGYDWPGNVRELINCLEHAVNNLAGDVLVPEYLPTYLVNRSQENRAMEQDTGSDEFQLKKREADTIREALEFHGGNISKTAKALGIGRNTLYAKMEKFHIQP
eukprot:TRINITY_DN2940_c5_g1_i1.p1 TRINITY_DN2940_c5_g1~~TRINITY_DN2940_c5_g1_i1.p1  ORF type:complete len:1297 (+),score=255.34 TRINITY_DN2940_c5_g1_i1:17584-21474(+)